MISKLKAHYISYVRPLVRQLWLPFQCRFCLFAIITDAKGLLVAVLTKAGFESIPCFWTGNSPPRMLNQRSPSGEASETVFRVGRGGPSLTIITTRCPSDHAPIFVFDIPGMDLATRETVSCSPMQQSPTPKRSRHAYESGISLSLSPSHLKPIESEDEKDEDVERLLPFKLSLVQSPSDTGRMVFLQKSDILDVPNSPNLSLYVQVMNLLNFP